MASKTEESGRMGRTRHAHLRGQGPSHLDRRPCHDDLRESASRRWPAAQPPTSLSSRL